MISFFWTFKEYCCCPSFAQKDLFIFLLYLFSNPYKLCRTFWEQENQGNLPNVPYGETPLRTWRKIAWEAHLGKKDVLLDLGCGRGRLLFWSLSKLGCKVIGVDSVPVFIQKAKFLATILRVKDASFSIGDLCSAPLEQATVIYFYASLADDELMADLAVWLSHVHHRPLIITVGCPLSDFAPNFLLEKEMEQDFGWGKTGVYFQRYRDRRLQESRMIS